MNIACVGVGGKGWDDMRGVSAEGARHNIVAICDIDQLHGGEQPPNLVPGQAARALGTGAAREMFPKAKVYEDFRKMLAQKDIDAVTVSTPDPMHATIAITAMQLGKHVYVQKPLTQTIHESRVMRRVAAETGVITRMGNQGHSTANYRSAVEAIRSAVIGRIREVHAWTRSPGWTQGVERPPGSDPVPKGVHWDLWLAIAEPRPYIRHAYHNFNWRGWREFGTGALGDMGCHIMDPAVWSLELGPPSQVSAKVNGPAVETYPKSSTVSYRFPGTAHTVGELALHWHDGGNNPPEEFLPVIGKTSNGTLYVGETGQLLLPHGASIARLFPKADFTNYSRTTLKEIYQGFAEKKLDHYQVWTDAILANKPANSHFGHAAPLNETVMIGTVAQRLHNRVHQWNAGAPCFDSSEATALVRRDYRKEWRIDALMD